MKYRKEASCFRAVTLSAHVMRANVWNGSERVGHFFEDEVLMKA
jgi:hypothetical protein